jgi:hypothetical protein
MIGLKSFGVISVLLIASSIIVPSIQPSYQTRVDVLYLQGPRVAPHQHIEDGKGPSTKHGSGIVIVAIHATISSLPDLNVQIWLEVEGVSTLQKFYHVNSGTLGTANSDLDGIAVYVPPESKISLGYWCDNLAAAERDFHASIEIFYQE